MQKMKVKNLKKKKMKTLKMKKVKMQKKKKKKIFLILLLKIIIWTKIIQKRMKKNLMKIFIVI